MYCSPTKTSPNQKVRSVSACRRWVQFFVVLEPKSSFVDCFLYENHIGRVGSSDFTLYDGGWQTVSTQKILNDLLFAAGSEYQISGSAGEFSVESPNKGL
jgi:hypothetical protein